MIGSWGIWCGFGLIILQGDVQNKILGRVSVSVWSSSQLWSESTDFMLE